MELFLAQNHSAMTHLPIATAILTAVAAILAVLVSRKEISLFCAVLSCTAVLTVMPTIITGVEAARGRFNDDGTPYLQSGVIVSNIPANARIFQHQMLGLSGTAVAVLLASLTVAKARGRSVNKYLIALLAILLAVLWGIGGHMGGEELWGANTFPAFQ